MHLQADVIEAEQVQWKAGEGGQPVPSAIGGTLKKPKSMGLKSIAFAHMQILYALRSLSLSLQICSVLNDDLLITQTVKRIYKTVRPILDTQKLTNSIFLLPILALVYQLVDQLRIKAESQLDVSFSKLCTRLVYELVELYQTHKRKCLLLLLLL